MHTHTYTSIYSQPSTGIEPRSPASLSSPLTTTLYSLFLAHFSAFYSFCAVKISRYFNEIIPTVPDV